MGSAKKYTFENLYNNRNNTFSRTEIIYLGEIWVTSI
jgi:hypothetical protein